MKTDIARTDLYIKKLIAVIKAQSFEPKGQVSGRHCDAFVYFLSGTCTYRFDDGTEFTVQAGDVLYLSHNANYTMHKTSCSFIFCDFEFDCQTERQSAVYTPKNRDGTENLFVKLFNRYTAPTKASFPETLSLLYEIYRVVQTAADNAYITHTARSRIGDVKAQIDTNYKNTGLSIGALAESAGMSQVYLRKLFRSQYGHAPAQYITSVRLSNAKKLMRYPFLTLEDCALQSGFSSLSYFCRVFKKETGMTPHQYRKQISSR